MTDSLIASLNSSLTALIGIRPLCRYGFSPQIDCYDIFSAFDDLAEKHGLEKIKTIGDAYMVMDRLAISSAG